LCKLSVRRRGEDDIALLLGGWARVPFTYTTLLVKVIQDLRA